MPMALQRHNYKWLSSCVHQPPPQLQRHRFSLWSWCRVLDPEMEWELLMGKLLHLLSPKLMRGEFLESPWALWHLESDPPFPIPWKWGRGRTWHWLREKLWLHQALGHSQKKKGVTRTNPFLGSDSEEEQGGRVIGAITGWWVCWKFLAATRGRPSLTVKGLRSHQSAVMHCSRCLKKSRRCLAT